MTTQTAEDTGTTLDPDRCPQCGGGEWEFLRGAHPVRIHCLGCNSVFTLGGQLVPALVPTADARTRRKEPANMNDTTSAPAHEFLNADGMPVWHLQAVALADTALSLAEQAAHLAAECASVAAAAHQHIDNVRLLIAAHQPVPAAAAVPPAAGDPR
jgi:hypothetical protein